MIKRQQKPLIFDTLSQAASHYGMSLFAIKTYKKKGAPGFRHGRVYDSEFGPWINSRRAVQAGVPIELWTRACAEQFVASREANDALVQWSTEHDGETVSDEVYQAWELAALANAQSVIWADEAVYRLSQLRRAIGLPAISGVQEESDTHPDVAEVYAKQTAASK